ncbi:hypothetical protein [Chlamydia buteonis]|uniref:hypothetical protein n=1 Tax=Chlamydia buteonis TaxID=2494525 RepID=UPI0020B8B195|nr:hypothetical protein [Chlamydia buteonis]
MKSSIPWLLISSTITFPLPSVATEKAIIQSSASLKTGEQTLSSNDNYNGSNSTETPFTCKNSSISTGTTYTLDSDVSFINVSKTQAPASQNNSEDTDTIETSSQSADQGSDTKDNTDPAGADHHPSPVSPEPSPVVNTSGDSTSPTEASGTSENTQDKESSKDADSTKAEEKTKTDNEVTETKEAKNTLEVSIKYPIHHCPTPRLKH